jgi:cytochrome c-L
MSLYNKSVLLVVMLGTLVACGKSENSTSAAGASGAEASGDVKAIAFEKTQDGSPLDIKHELFTTPAAKEFLATGKNPYIGNAEMIAKGKKIFGLYSCTQCHGPEAKGQVGPGLVGPTFKYPKDATNKGMFETIWNGTNGGMGGKGIGIMNPNDPKDGITPDEVLQVQAWIRSMSDGITGNE